MMISNPEAEMEDFPIPDEDLDEAAAKIDSAFGVSAQLEVERRLRDAELLGLDVSAAFWRRISERLPQSKMAPT